MAYLKEKNNHFFIDSQNKFLKHVFDIILKLNNRPWRKVWNQFFVGKNDAQSSGFAVVKKAPRKKNFLIRNSSSLFVQIRSTKPCADFFKNECVSRYLTFGNFQVPKNCSSL